MIKRIFVPLFFGVVFAFILINIVGARNPKRIESHAPEEIIRIIETNPGNLILELQIPEYRITHTAVDGDYCDSLEVEDFGYTTNEGWPQLPTIAAVVGIPPGDEPIIRILESEAKSIDKVINLCPVPTQVVGFDPSGKVSHTDIEFYRNDEAYSNTDLYPNKIIETTAIGNIRSQRILQMRINPFQYHPASGAVRYYQRMVVSIQFPSQSTDPSALEQVRYIDEGSFEDLLAEMLVNYQQAKKWRYKPPKLFSPDPYQDPASSAMVKVLVDQDGIYKITYEDLSGIVRDLGNPDVELINLRNKGNTVAINIEDGDDGTFDAEDYILFYGEKINNKFTDTNVYWLNWQAADGISMTDVDGSITGSAEMAVQFKTTERVEENHVYQSAYPSGPDNDHWYWEIISANNATGPITKTYTINLPFKGTEPFSATVRGLLRSYAAVPHHYTKILLNGKLLTETVWLSQGEYAFEVTVDDEYLLEGANKIQLVIPMDAGITQEILFTNWFEIDYERSHQAVGDRLIFSDTHPGTWDFQVGGFTSDTVEAYNITNPLRPIQILSGTLRLHASYYQYQFEDSVHDTSSFLIQNLDQRLNPTGLILDSPSDLKNPSNNADYIIVTYDEFYDQVIPLADWRTAQGLNVLVVKIQDVYDEFNYGVFSPQAIQDFIKYAYENWTNQPAYVLLVGDGNFDFLDNFGWSELNYIPPYLDDVDPWIGEVATDNRFVSVSGDDIFPDMHIGRLAVKTSEEAAVVVNKILNYEQNKPSDYWNRQITFVADNYDPGAGDFSALSEVIANQYLPPFYSPKKIYYSVTHDLSEAQQAIIDHVNQGKLIVNYIGHSGTQHWASEKLLSIDSINLLSNADRFPMMVPMSCLDGNFIWPNPPGKNFSSLGESLVNAEGKGAIASWSPTGFGVATGHEFLNKGLYNALFKDDSTIIGPATTQAKFHLISSTAEYNDLVETYMLFGDPATQLHISKTGVAIEKEVEPVRNLIPGEFLTYTLTFNNAFESTANNVVISDVLPAQLINPSVESSGAIISPRKGSQFIWDVENLSPGEGGIITITAQVEFDYEGDITNTAASSCIQEGNLYTNTSREVISHVKGILKYYLPIMLSRLFD